MSPIIHIGALDDEGHMICIKAVDVGEGKLRRQWMDGCPC